MKNILLVIVLFLSYSTGIAQAVKPTLDIECIIIWTEKNTLPLNLFQEKGFTISPTSVTHTGMGTAERHINFYNMMVLFMYPDEKATLDSKLDKRLFLPRDKWRERGESPFEIGLVMIPYDTTKLPFAAKKVQAPWMRPNTGVYFAISNHSHKGEPMVLVMPSYMDKPKLNSLEDIDRMITDEGQRNLARQTLVHSNGVQKLTDLKITCTTKEFSSTINALQGVENCQIIKGKEHLLEMTFDENRQKQTLDFRPRLPVVINY